MVTIFLAKSRRMSATLVGAIGGIFTPGSFLALHLFGSATGLWGVWNFSYFELMKGVTYQGNFYQGVDWISWVLLLHMLPCCIPARSSALSTGHALKRKPSVDKQSVVLGCGCEVFGDEAQELKQRFKLLRLLIASTALSMPLLWNLPPMVQLVFATALQLYPGMYFVRNALRGLRSLTMGMDLLVALSTTAI